MSQIEIPDWVARKVLAGYLREWDDCSESNKQDLAKIMAEALRAALEGWVVPVGVRYRVAPNDASRARPWEGAGIVAEWNRSLPNSSETLQYQPLYTIRKEPAA